jgi:hypothetical protein
MMQSAKIQILCFAVALLVVIPAGDLLLPCFFVLSEGICCSGPNTARMAAMRRILALVLLTTAALLGQAAWPYATDPDGRPITTLADATTRAVVLYFVASDCPISNRTFPEMKRVRQEFSTQGVRFWFVYANTDELPATIKAHQRSYDPDGTAILDPTGTLVRLTGAKVTPEVAILTPSPGSDPDSSQWIPRYTGRIDDRYIRLGLERPQATQHFAERVLHEILTGAPIEKPTGQFIGCAIVSPETQAQPQSMTSASHPRSTP